jgi:hypothetical protein
VTIRDTRFAVLFLRSRQTTPISLALIAVAVVAGLAIGTSNNDDLTRLLRMVGPLAAAVVIGTAAGSPFGEAERTGSRALPRIRFGHLAFLIGAGAAFLAFAVLVSGEDGYGSLFRNGAGLVGLSLFGARLGGAGVSWMVPLAYAGVVFADFLVKPDRDASWRWPLQPSDDAASWLIAGVLLVAGLGVVSWHGSRDTGAESTV